MNKSSNAGRLSFSVRAWGRTFTTVAFYYIFKWLGWLPDSLQNASFQHAVMVCAAISLVIEGFRTLLVAGNNSAPTAQ